MSQPDAFVFQPKFHAFMHSLLKIKQLNYAIALHNDFIYSTKGF